MNRFLFILLLVLIVTAISNALLSKEDGVEKFRFDIYTTKKIVKDYKDLKKICMADDYLYYDWSGRPLGLCIPVVENNELVRCTENGQ